MLRYRSQTRPGKHLKNKKIYTDRDYNIYEESRGETTPCKLFKIYRNIVIIFYIHHIFNIFPDLTNYFATHENDMLKNKIGQNILDKTIIIHFV